MIFMWNGSHFNLFNKQGESIKWMTFEKCIVKIITLKDRIVCAKIREIDRIHLVPRDLNNKRQGTYDGVPNKRR